MISYDDSARPLSNAFRDANRERQPTGLVGELACVQDDNAKDIDHPAPDGHMLVYLLAMPTLFNHRVHPFCHAPKHFSALRLEAFISCYQSNNGDNNPRLARQCAIN